MKLVIQRVIKAKVQVGNETIGEINKGLMVLVGIETNDTKIEAEALSDKLCSLRIFEDEENKLNYNINQVNGQLLIVSQFTLCANTQKGNRPSFENAKHPTEAKKLYEYFCNCCIQNNIQIQTGLFGENMKVTIVNDGPFTLVLDK